MRSGIPGDRWGAVLEIKTDPQPLCPTDHVQPTPDPGVEGESLGQHGLPLLLHHFEMQRRDRSSRLTLQHFCRPGTQRSQPVLLRGGKTNLVLTIKNHIGNNATHGTSKHSFACPIRSNQVLLWQGGHKIDQSRSQEWCATFNRKCHRIAVFVAQEHRQTVLSHCLPEVLPQDLLLPCVPDRFGQYPMPGKPGGIEPCWKQILTENAMQRCVLAGKYKHP